MTTKPDSFLILNRDQVRPDMYRTSHSRINTFRECKAFYKHRYIDRVQVPGTEPYFILGSAYHSGMEMLYNNPAPKKTHEEAQALIRSGIDEYWLEFFNEHGLIDLIDDFFSYEEMAGSKLEWLAWRATAECTDPALMIRNQNGSIPKKLESNSKYKSEYEALGLESMASDLNQRARGLSSYLVASPDVQLCEVFADSYKLGRLYRDYSDIEEIMGVELAFSQFSEDDDSKGELINAATVGPYIFQGFIDLLVRRTHHGITITDHKTSKTEMTELDVLHHEQLNLYAAALKEAFGIVADSLCINNARFGTKVVVPIDWNIVERVVQRKIHELDDIAKEEKFLTQDPFNKYASKACLGNSKGPYGPDDMKKVCHFLALCHPELHARLQERNKPAEFGDVPPFPTDEPVQQTVVPPSDTQRQIEEEFGLAQF